MKQTYVMASSVILPGNGSLKDFKFKKMNMCSRYSTLEIPDRITMREVWGEFNGTIIGLDDIAVENEGELYIWSYANTQGSPVGTINVTNITVRAGGKFEPLASDRQIVIEVVRMIINGKGYVRTNNMHLFATNVTIDLSGRYFIEGFMLVLLSKFANVIMKRG